MRFAMLRISPLSALCACVLALSTNLSAQTATAELVGAVTDSSGAGIPKAKVTITNVSTNLVIREIESDSSGTYIATLIPPGDYTISVEASGFRKLVQTGIKLETNQRARIDLPLQVGQV